jgi:ketosteroid isomerase-like protein
MFKVFAAILFALAVAVPALPAAAAENAAVMASVNQFVDGFNKGDTKTALAACASPASIIDEFGRHEWVGPTACADWAHDYAADDARQGITDGIVTLGKPWRVDVNGNVAYVVVPATYTYKQHGKSVHETGSVWTLVLNKGASGWRIAAWAWAAH